ncbi:MAG: Holliday junction branch migration DNA helicase RuvB, partial [Coprobacillus sp.]
MDDRDILDVNIHNDDEENQLRPQSFEEYVGQNDLKNNLKVFVGAAKLRNESLDHVLLYGPPGLGKTTMSMIIANEMGTHLKTTTGPSIEKTGDLVAILTSLEPGDVLFIDEIHRLNKVIEEILYPAMEDFCVDVVIGKEASTRSVRIDLPPFTLVGATTRAGDLSAPLRDRFGIISKLEYYNVEELTRIIDRTSRVYQMDMDMGAIQELAKRSRGTPRIANRLFRRVRDFAQYNGDEVIGEAMTIEALQRLKVDELGLDDVDHKYLLGIIQRF